MRFAYAFLATASVLVFVSGEEVDADRKRRNLAKEVKKALKVRTVIQSAKKKNLVKGRKLSSLVGDDLDWSVDRRAYFAKGSTVHNERWFIGGDDGGGWHGEDTSGKGGPIMCNEVTAESLWQEHNAFDKPVSQVLMNDWSYGNMYDDNAIRSCEMNATMWEEFGQYTVYPEGFKIYSQDDQFADAAERGGPDGTQACYWDYADDHAADEVEHDYFADYLTSDLADYWAGMCCNAMLDQTDRTIPGQAGTDNQASSSNCAGMDFPHCRPGFARDGYLWSDQDTEGRFVIAKQCTKGQRLTIAAGVPAETITMYNRQAVEHPGTWAGAAAKALRPFDQSVVNEGAPEGFKALMEEDVCNELNMRACKGKGHVARKWSQTHSMESPKKACMFVRDEAYLTPDGKHAGRCRLKE